MNHTKNIASITPRSQFEAQLKAILQQQHQQLSSKPQELTKIIPKHNKDQSSQFYRLIQPLDEHRLVFKLGWKIVDLAPEQIDLTLFCLALLSSKMKIPMKGYLSQTEDSKNQGKDVREGLWVQACVMGIDSGSEQCQSGLQFELFEFVGKCVVPRLRSFIASEINWGKMVRANFEDSIVVNKFDKQVIEWLNNDISKYQFIK